MSRLEITPQLVTAIASSMMFRTFARVYEDEFGVPLYFESARQQGVDRTTGNESEFCVELNGGDGCCTRCVCRVLPPPETLMPWTWSAPCRAGQQVTMVPVIGLGIPIAWLVSGHYFIGTESGASRELPREAMRAIGSDKERRKNIKQAFLEIKSIPQARHERMVRYLETCCALIGADLNHFLTDGSHAMQGSDERKAVVETKREAPAPGTFLGKDEIATRCRLETARRHFLRTGGQDTEIGRAAKDAGWADEADFQRDFQECFGESPFQHWKRVTGLWHDFSVIIAASEQDIS